MDSDKRIKRILIVGGGTSGWLSAGYLQRALGDTVEITLLESSDIGTIGVGEATLPTFKRSMEFLGFQENDWLPHVNGTFKNAIKFANWMAPSQRNPRNYYWHPFWNVPEPSANPFGAPWFVAFGEGVDLFQYYLKERLQGGGPIPDAYLPLVAVSEANKAPRSFADPKLNLNCAYHLDAGLLVTFLRKQIIARGVKNVLDQVIDVSLDERGYIRSLRTQQGRELGADLFIDCSGFRGLLINQALGASFRSDNPALLCNAAVAIPSRNDPEHDGIPPYVTATALASGWAWSVPLFHRNGNGYVYCDAFCSKDQAEAELRALLGPRCAGMPANHIRMRVGRTETPWVKNCVAIGLSSCFLEPLESTGILLSEIGVSLLVTLFPDLDFGEGRIKKYNKAMQTFYEQTRDFIVLHYISSDRRDTPFWNAVQDQTQVPATLADELEYFRDGLPLLGGLTVNVFRSLSYMSILDGCNKLPHAPYPLLEHTGYQSGRDALARSRAHIAQLLNELPDHYAYIKRIHQLTGPEPPATIA